MTEHLKVQLYKTIQEFGLITVSGGATLLALQILHRDKISLVRKVLDEMVKDGLLSRSKEPRGKYFRYVYKVIK